MNLAHKLTLLSVAVTVLLSGCAVQPKNTYQISPGAIAKTPEAALITSEPVVSDAPLQKARVVNVDSPGLPSAQLKVTTSLADLFSDTEQVVFSADQLSLKDFIHNLFSDLLKRSYVITNEIAALEEPVTLTIKEPISQRQAFRLAFDMLQKKGISLAEKDGVFYLASGSEQSSATMAVGGNATDVPNVPGSITQVVPLRYGNPSLESSIASFVPVRVVRDTKLNTLFITGNYPDIVRALDLVKLLDMPANRGRYIRLIRLTYLTPEDFSKKVQQLLESEGIDDVGVGSALGKNLVLVPIDNLGAVAVFSANRTYVERTIYWAEQIDVAGEGTQKRYFIYHPAYARAADLGSSVAALLGQSQSLGNNSRDTRSALGSGSSTGSSAGGAGSGMANTGSSDSATRQAVSVQNENLAMTVDERSNTLIFYTTGSEYQTILPMVKRLDVMPKQVLLEATIAEVTLTDDFQMGIEFAFKDGKLSGGTSGALGVGSIGGLNLGYVDGANSVLARLKQSNQQVNVLSNPSIVVRDGVNAAISVGTEIPTISSTTSDPLLSDKQVTSISYRQTGLEFTVMPTINGQGLVVMQIQQNISNTAEGSVVQGAPAIFKRTLQTEVIAQSGQTVLLGGLISENNDSGDTAVPGLASLPLIGNLFKSQTNKKSKTELVLLITPRVIDATEQWNYINGRLKEGFNHLQITD